MISEHGMLPNNLIFINQKYDYFIQKHEKMLHYDEIC